MLAHNLVQIWKISATVFQLNTTGLDLLCRCKCSSCFMCVIRCVVASVCLLLLPPNCGLAAKRCTCEPLNSPWRTLLEPACDSAEHRKQQWPSPSWPDLAGWLTKRVFPAKDLFSHLNDKVVFVVVVVVSKLKKTRRLVQSWRILVYLRNLPDKRGHVVKLLN